MRVFFYALLHKSCTIIARAFHFGDRLTAVCYKQKSAGGAVMFIIDLLHISKQTRLRSYTLRYNTT